MPLRGLDQLTSHSSIFVAHSRHLIDIFDPLFTKRNKDLFDINIYYREVIILFFSLLVLASEDEMSTWRFQGSMTMLGTEVNFKFLACIGLL